jgi:DNA repair protein RecO (recombination protein O)
VFLLRLLDVAGLAFAAEACAACGSGDDLDRIGVAEGGALCPGCATPQSYKVDGSTVRLLSSLSSGRVSDTARMAGAPPRWGEAAGIVRRFTEYHLEARLRAATVVSHM